MVCMYEGVVRSMGWSCSRVGALWMPGTLQGALWYYGMGILELLDQKWMLFQCHVILDVMMTALCGFFFSGVYGPLSFILGVME